MGPLLPCSGNRNADAAPSTGATSASSRGVVLKGLQHGVAPGASFPRVLALRALDDVLSAPCGARQVHRWAATKKVGARQHPRRLDAHASCIVGGAFGDVACVPMRAEQGRGSDWRRKEMERKGRQVGWRKLLSRLEQLPQPRWHYRSVRICPASAKPISSTIKVRKAPSRTRNVTRQPPDRESAG